MEDKRPLMVTVQCLAYNQEPYIRDCLEGIVKQKTNFRFEAIVHDDMSKDGTANIIREYAEIYPEIIKPIFETENQYSKKDGSLEKIMNKNSHGKYIAICEGDDYWIDPYKLQKQVCFMENNLEYGLCYTKAKLLKDGEIIGEFGTSDTSFEGLLSYSNFPTLTRLYRRTLWDSYFREINPYSKSWMMGDYPMAFYFALKSKIKYIEGFTGVYRIVGESASHSSDIDYLFRFYDSADSVRHFFIQKYVKDELDRVQYNKLIRKNEIEYKVSKYLHFNKRKEARRFYLSNRKDIEPSAQLLYNIRTCSLFLNKCVNFFFLMCNYLNKLL